jgi:putative glutamine amidotransferase
MASRPLIGITTYLQEASWGIWRQVPAAVLPYAYVRAVEQAGGRALLLPPTLDDRNEEESAADIVDVLDGLVLSGGADVDPARYRRPRHPQVQASQPWRDELELALASAAEAADLPVLGVCRGMEVMAVAAGGSLHQHLPDLVGHAEHSPGADVYGEHPVDVRPGTVLHALVGDRLMVHSHHHQAVADAPGYDVSATAPDGTVEAMEAPGSRFRLAVQWHPEVADTWPLFVALIRAAAGDRVAAASREV